MKRFVALLAAGMLIGCESAVLVNNRPERTPGMEDVTPATPAEQTQQASGSQSADMDLDRAQTAGATTQPADQQVETSNTRIESHSN